MTDLVDKLLLLARADAGELHPLADEIDVADFVHEVSSRWSRKASMAGVRLEVVAPHTGLLRADEGLTRRILDNLIENAIRHSPSNGRVRIQASRDGVGWAFDVADQGEGVPARERARIFTRFTRLDLARNRNDGGAGLGLALTAAFAEVQGGHVRLIEDPDWGAVFRAWLPGASAADLASATEDGHTDRSTPNRLDGELKAVH
jgi:two-component system sensor histidine kinase BaeS